MTGSFCGDDGGGLGGGGGFGELADFLGYVFGDGVVADELPGEGAAAAGHGAEVGGVVEEFGHGAFGEDVGVGGGVVGLFHAEDAGAAGVEVADDVAGGLVGDEDAVGLDGFEQDGACGAGGFAEGPGWRRV